MTEKPKIVLATLSPTGTYHRVHASSGVATFCGLDLSTRRRLGWAIFEAELTPLTYDNMCRRCMPVRRPT